MTVVPHGESYGEMQDLRYDLLDRATCSLPCMLSSFDGSLSQASPSLRQAQPPTDSGVVAGYRDFAEPSSLSTIWH